MIQHLRTALAGGFALLLAACGGPAGDPASAAHAFIKAAAAKDVKALIPLLAKEPRAQIEKRLKEDPTATIINDENAKIYLTADASFEGPRYDEDTALIRVSEPDGDRDVKVLMLMHEPGGWMIQNEKTISQTRFNALPAKAPPPLDRSDPTVVARAYLTAYLAKDGPMIKRLSPSESRDNIQAMIDIDPAAGGLFDAQKLAAIQDWQKQLEGPRYHGKTAAFRVNAPNAMGQIAILIVDQQNGSWVAESISSATMEEFQKASKTPES